MSASTAAPARETAQNAQNARNAVPEPETPAAIREETESSAGSPPAVVYGAPWAQRRPVAARPRPVNPWLGL